MAPQFGRAMNELHITGICTNTSSAKGRVERAHRTLQDRLVKELRLRCISTLEAANAFADEFMEDGLQSHHVTILTYIASWIMAKTCRGYSPGASSVMSRKT